jgi:hypothetical protein
VFLEEWWGKEAAARAVTVVAVVVALMLLHTAMQVLVYVDMYVSADA